MHGHVLRDLALALTLTFTVGAVCADEEGQATREECVAKCEAVVKIIQEKDLDAAVEAVHKEGSPFVWKDTYVYIMDLDAKILAHGVQPKFIGRNLMGLKDPKTKQPWYPAVFEAIKKDKNAKGWFEYHWIKPGGKTPMKKICYYVREGDAVVFAGIYEEEDAEAKTE